MIEICQLCTSLTYSSTSASNAASLNRCKVSIPESLLLLLTISLNEVIVVVVSSPLLLLPAETASICVAAQLPSSPSSSEGSSTSLSEVLLLLLSLVLLLSLTSLEGTLSLLELVAASLSSLLLLLVATRAAKSSLLLSQSLISESLVNSCPALATTVCTSVGLSAVATACTISIIVSIGTTYEAISNYKSGEYRWSSRCCCFFVSSILLDHCRRLVICSFS